VDFPTLIMRRDHLEQRLAPNAMPVQSMQTIKASNQGLETNKCSYLPGAVSGGMGGLGVRVETHADSSGIVAVMADADPGHLVPGAAWLALDNHQGRATSESACRGVGAGAVFVVPDALLDRLVPDHNVVEC
jgi:hypothetical protein